jgi:hypothetical protein
MRHGLSDRTELVLHGVVGAVLNALQQRDQQKVTIVVAVLMISCHVLRLGSTGIPRFPPLG